MFEHYVSEKLLASMKYRGEEDFMAQAPAPYYTTRSSWVCVALSNLGDALIRAGLTLKRRYQVEQPVISAY